MHPAEPLGEVGAPARVNTERMRARGLIEAQPKSYLPD